MVSAIEAVGNAVRSGLCTILGQGEAGAGFVSRVYGTSFGAYSGAAGLRRQFCSDDPDNDPVYEPPFEGGQCDDVYVVTATRTTNLSGTATFTFRARGPIGGVRLRQISGNNYDWEVFASNVNFSQTTCGVLAAGTPGWFRIGGVNSSDGNQTTSITSVSPCGADNCGNIAPVLPPPEPITFPPSDVTYNIDDSTEITVPLTVVVAPVFLSFDGSLKVPISINLGGLDFDGSVTIAPEFELNIKPSIRIGGPGAVDDPDVIGEPGGGAEPIPDVEDLESTIVGVLVYSDIDSEATPSGVAFTNGPDLYVPRMASVQFAIKTRDSIGWTPDQDVKNAECYVPCPAPQGAIAVRVSPMPGVQSRFTAVRGVPLTSF